MQITIRADEGKWLTDGEIYGKTVTVEFLERIRGDKKFESIDELKKQIEHDIEMVRKINL